jgi:hypothetical protein
MESKALEKKAVRGGKQKFKKQTRRITYTKS